ncbi:uncharacterized protein LY89DRAFT_778315 [Mollisia scopiformis]|uniref:Uncharacterized protein n=1 Tax=Mollisia scopiformis TaxID=149040 RepID=A0A194XQF3_MOLSC|nr:uncharacterized protein LY89DRAFT_778315 [Mollisia scopiformis]KUJ21967.1 hypothetical protein LY89DRAFT_778315 [Mollisia scopiformis]
MLMQACREAREIGQKMQMPFYSYHADQWFLTAPKCRSYINIDIDTIWLHRTLVMPDHVHFYRGPQSVSTERDDVSWDLEGAKCQPQFRFNCLAMDADIWEDPVVDIRRNEHVGSTDVLRMANSPRELYIVVARPRVFSSSKIVFVKPSLLPHEICAPDRAQYRTGMYPPDNLVHPDHTYTWEKAARRLETLLTQFKDKRAKDRKTEIEENGWTLDELDNWVDFVDLSNLEIPKVRYVEAVEYTHDWA